MRNRLDNSPHKTSKPGASPLLAPLRVGDRIPWKPDRRGEPQWLTVIASNGAGEYIIRYPNGTTETLKDTD